jgi:2-polyprenyl-3-methyl-5-hydroxy-6-metoxy-1,4-benzoquinol methylase
MKDDYGNLTTKAYWDSIYCAPREHELCIEGFRNRCERKIFSLLKDELSSGKRVLEIGAGDSLWLPFLARNYPDIHFSGLDYSESGCERLAKRAAGLGVDVILEDFLQERSNTTPRFDLVISFGVVEHFESLEDVLRAMRKYLAQDGRVFTVIPNMSGLLGLLTKRFSQSIYFAHNPHTLERLVAGHESAGFSISSAGYLGSTNFGVLSAAVTRKAGAAYHAYLWLTRLSKAIFYLEEKIVDLPATQFFSPYIYCIGKKQGDA